MKEAKKRQMVIIALVIVLVGMGIAYAAMSATLNITVNKITEQAIGPWDVHLDTTGSPLSATVGGTSATGRSCGTATVTATSVTLADTTLSKPDDSCRYTLSIVNGGGMPAKLSSITPTKPSGITCGTATGGKMICGNITYILATNTTGTTPLAQNSTIAAGATTTVYLMVKYTGTTVNSSTVTHTGAKFTLTYVPV